MLYLKPTPKKKRSKNNNDWQSLVLIPFCCKLAIVIELLTKVAAFVFSLLPGHVLKLLKSARTRIANDLCLF